MGQRAAAQAQPAPQPPCVGAVPADAALAVDAPTVANTEIIRRAPSCPCGQAAVAPDSAAGRRSSKRSSQESQRYS